MKIDASSPVPVFEQIARLVRGGVASGVFRPGECVPSVREMALRLLVNPNTVQRAYQELERDGLLVTRKGVGMEVVASTTASARRRAAEDVAEELRRVAGAAVRAGVTRGEVDAMLDRAWAAATRGTATKEVRR